VRILTAVVTAVTFLALGVSASAACDGMKRDQTAAKTDGTVYYPPAESS
jgi:hypothetical protein